MKRLKFLPAAMIIAVSFSSCATVLTGKTNAYQTTKPKDGEPQRQVRVGYIVANGFLTGGLGLLIDFATGAIYKPQPSQK